MSVEKSRGASSAGIALEIGFAGSPYSYESWSRMTPGPGGSIRTMRSEGKAAAGATRQQWSTWTNVMRRTPHRPDLGIDPATPTTR